MQGAGRFGTGKGQTSAQSFPTSNNKGPQTSLVAAQIAASKVTAEKLPALTAPTHLEETLKGHTGPVYVTKFSSRHK